MKNWDLEELELKPRLPEILSSSREGRVIALDLSQGEQLGDHEVHERAWLLVIAGELEVTTASGTPIRGVRGSLVEFAPAERHEVVACSDARLLLLLAPWPGHGHPGGMSMREKLYARRHAAKQRKRS